MNKKIIILVVILIIVFAVVAIRLYQKSSSVSKNISASSLSGKRVISSKGNIKVFDDSGDNPLCGNITVSKDNSVVASFGMCEENITDVEYGYNSVTLKTDGGGMSGKSRFIEINWVTGTVSRK